MQLDDNANCLSTYNTAYYSLCSCKQLQFSGSIIQFRSANIGSLSMAGLIVVMGEKNAVF